MENYKNNSTGSNQSGSQGNAKPKPDRPPIRILNEGADSIPKK